MSLYMRLVRDYPDWGEVLAHLHAAFAYMEGRIDPPSSLNRLDAQTLAAQARDGHWQLGHLKGTLAICAYLEMRPQTLYLGKIAVAPALQGHGLCRFLMDGAAVAAKNWGKRALELQTRVELVENHAAFAAMGFVKVGETAHPGFDRPTSITMERPL